MVKFKIPMLYIILVSCIQIVSCSKQSQTNEKIIVEDNSLSFDLKSSDKTGVTFNNHIEEKIETFFDSYAYIYSGGGVAVGDINGDNLQDIYFTGNEVEDKLYINKGDFVFEDITKKALLSGQEGWHNGVTILDINADGLNDIYVCRGGWKESPELRRNLFYVNQGDGTFKEEASKYGIADEGYSMQALFLDIDNDNDLDLYLTNRPDEFYLPLSKMKNNAEIGPDCCTDRLYENVDGQFVDVSRESGIINYGYSLGLAAADFNNDGWIDIYVSNDFATVDHMYINQKDGTFKDELKEALNHISLFSMGTDVVDFNNDGLEDIFVMEMRPEDYVRSKVSMPPMNIEGYHAIVDAGMHKQHMHNMLHMNMGAGKFSEVAQLAGISKTDWSWSGLFGDFDRDGLKDIFITNGMRRDLFDGDAQKRLTHYVEQNKEKYKNINDLFETGFKGVVDSYKPLKLKNYLLKGNGNLSFSNIGSNSNVHTPSISNGSALVDLDNDGDLDIVVNNMEESAFVLENTSVNDHYWTKLKLEGPPKNKAGLGAKVWVYTSSGEHFFQQKIVRGYLSSSDEHIFFGLNDDPIIDSVVVRWPDDKVSSIKNPSSNELITIDYINSHQRSTSQNDEQLLFTHSSDVMNPVHMDVEDELFEYNNQILLPHSFATSGPKMSAADVNKDGTDDFFIGGSKSEPGALYLSSKGKWVKDEQRAFFMDRVFEDMGSVFIDYDNDDDYDLYVVSGGSNGNQGTHVLQDRLYENRNGVFTKTSIPRIASNGSSVLAEDLDNDGDQDILVGGFLKTNTYPQNDASLFLENQNGKFVDATLKWAGDQLENIGIIYDVQSVQLDNDEELELVLVGEWMPISILDWDGSSYKNKTEEYGLSDTKGWWTSVSSIDLDNDGLNDLIIGNLGENYKFKVDDLHQFEVYADDFDKNGTYDVFLATTNEYGHKPVRGLECSSEQMPLISQKFKSFESFAKAEIDDIIGPDIKDGMSRSIDIFSSVVLYNNGDQSFTLNKLPMMSQLSVVNAIIAEDVNNDGLTDLITAGNRFNVEVETTPSDASMGSLLINEGNRSWRSVPPYKSGLYLNQDIKDLLFIDDVLISSENSGPVRAWRLKKDKVSL